MSLHAVVDAQVPGRNVNMVSGTTLPDGDPFLQRQNEPSGAVSTRNPLHLLAGANDYRTVDLPGLPEWAESGDAWLGIFRSYNGGQTWRSTLIPGYPQDKSAAGLGSPIYGYQAAADPTVRAGTNGLFYYSGIAFNRGAQGKSAVFVSRFIDNNNDSGGDSIQFLDTTVIDDSVPAKFIDKPYIAVDIPRPGGPSCTIKAPGTNGATQTFAAGTVYLAYQVFNTTVTPPTSRLMMTRSTNCGATWEKPTKVKDLPKVNQGVQIAIDPQSGMVYLAWRAFADPTGGGDAIMFSKPDDLSKLKFKDAVAFPFKPFDQGTSTTSFRTNAYPTVAVDGSSRIYVTWSERGWGPVDPATPSAPGDARVVMITSKDGGNTWTARQPIENDSAPGHQIMPVVTATGGKVSVVYYDLREDVSHVFKLYVDEANIPAGGKRHTLDLRILQADPADVPIFAPSARVSDYVFGILPDPTGPGKVEQLQFNVPNLPLYAKGSSPFIGDFIDLSGESFVRDATGKWVFNTNGPKTLHAFWTDNRDVRPPLDGDWTHYTPPNSIYTSQVCTPGQTGMRNSNIYTSSITPGLLVGTPSNTKRLLPGGNPADRRSFVVFAQNNTDQLRLYRFTIANQPPGGIASFLQFSPFTDPLTHVDVEIAPRSMASRTVYVSSSDPTASVTVNVAEVQSSTSLGLTGSVTLNPDPTNPTVTNPTVTNLEEFNPTVTNPTVTNPTVTNPTVTNPTVTNPTVTNPTVTNPTVTNVDVANPTVTNPTVTNPTVTNPTVTNSDIVNSNLTADDFTGAGGGTKGIITDTTWTVKNNGNTPGSFAVKTLLTKDLPANHKAMLLLFKTNTTPTSTPTDCDLKTQSQMQLVASIPNPTVTNPTVTNPTVTNTQIQNDVTNPTVTNASLWLDVGEEAKITFRVLNPDRTQTVTETVTRPNGTQETVYVSPTLNPEKIAAPVVVPTTVNTTDAAAGITSVTIAAPLVITTTTLDAAAGIAYSAQLGSIGGTGATTWSLSSGAMPAGLQLSPAGVISGMPTTAGAFTIHAQVIDSDTPMHTALADILLRVAPTSLSQTVSTAEDQPVAITLGAVGLHSTPFIFLTTTPAQGTLSGTAPNLVYTPNANFNGSDSFTFTTAISTDSGLVVSATATISISVSPVNDPPTFTKDADDTVLEGSGQRSVPAWATNISLGPANETNGGCQPYVASVCSQTGAFTVTNDKPSLFSVQPAITPDGTLSYTPAAGANGTAVVTVALHDDGGTANGGSDTSPSQTFTITVTPVNDAPTADAQSVTTNENTPVAIVLSGSDVETQPANFTATIIQPAHGTVSGQWPNYTYTPATNYYGSDSFQFTVTDRGNPDNCSPATPNVCASALTSAAATVMVTVIHVNQPPVASQQTVTTNDGVPVATTLAATDVDTPVSSLIYSIVTQPSHGTLSGTAPNLTYTSTIPYNGPDSFTFKVNDGMLDSNVATVTVTVTHVNRAPVAVNDGSNGSPISVTVGGDNVINVLTNDFDIDNQAQGQVVSSTTFTPAGVSGMLFPNVAAVANTANGYRVYVANGSNVAVIDPATDAILTTIPLTFPVNPNLARVNQTTGFIYLKQGNTLTAIDTATNTVAATIGLSGLVAFDIDETRGRLYATGSGSAFVVIDVNPSSPTGTFHQIVDSVGVGGSPFPSFQSVAVNAATNKVYLASTPTPSNPTALPGVWVFDVQAHTINNIYSSSPVQGLAVNPVANLVFASPSDGASLIVIDPSNGNAATAVALNAPPQWPGFTVVNRHLAVDTANGRVYVRSFTDQAHTGVVSVIDGDRASATFKTLLATIPVGRDSSALDTIVVDEALHRVLVTATDSLQVTVIDGQANPPAVIGSPLSIGQPISFAALKSDTHTVYVASGLTTVQTVNLSDATPAVGASILLAAESGAVAVDVVAHKAYAPNTVGNSGIALFNANGPAGTLSGLPTSAGRYIAAASVSATHRLYTINQSANTTGTTNGFPSFVSVIDTDPSSPTFNAVLTNVPVGNQSINVATARDPNNNSVKVFVGGAATGPASNGISAVSGSITVIDGATNTPATVDTSNSLFTGISFNGQFAYNSTTGKTYFRTSGNGTTRASVGWFDSSNVATPLTTVTAAPGCYDSCSPSPVTIGQVQAIRVSSAHNRIYLATADGWLLVLNGTDHSLIARLGLGSSSPVVNAQSYIAVDDTVTANGQLYLASYSDSFIAVIDATTGVPLAYAATGIGPTGVSVNTATHRVYIGNVGDNTITFLDGISRSVVGTLAVPLRPAFLSVDPGESRVYVSTGSAPTAGVVVIADLNGTVDHTLSINGITQGAQGTVSLIDAQGNDPAPGSGLVVRYRPNANATGQDTFTYTITDGAATSNAATVTVNITPALTITTTSLPPGLKGQSYTQSLSAIGGTPPYLWTTATTPNCNNCFFPGGLSLTTAGQLKGVPAFSGVNGFTVQVQDAAGRTATAFLSLVVGPPNITTSSPLPSATRGQPYNQTLNASNVVSPVWSLVSGSLPANLDLGANGTISGTVPATAACQSSSFTVKVTDSAYSGPGAPSAATKQFSIFVGGPVSISTTSIPPGVTLEGYNANVSATCGTGQVTWTFSNLPNGITGSSNGHLSGTPTRNGTFTISATATDSASAPTSDTKPFTLNINAVDQQPNSVFSPSPNTSVTFGSSTSTARVAQTVSVGATGTLTGVRFPTLVATQNASCAATATIEGVEPFTGKPDDNHILGTSALTTITFSNQTIPLSPASPASLFLTADTAVAVVLSATGSCQIPNAPLSDNYVDGAAFVDTAGNGAWATSASGFAAVDLPMNTLIQNTNLTARTAGNVNGQLQAVTLTTGPNSGKVLLVGGTSSNNTDAPLAEIYDPANGSVTATTPPNYARTDAILTMLGDGRVLMIGGTTRVNNVTTYLNTAEIYDPAAGTWTATGTMSTVRAQHAAVLLNDGRVLVTGGIDSNNTTLGSAEIFTTSGAGGTFSSIANMGAARNRHQMTLLSCTSGDPNCGWGGSVLVSGGFISNNISAELFRPSDNTFNATGAMVTSRAAHTATAINGGTQVLIAGGQSNDGTNTLSANGEVYTASTGTFADAGPMMEPRKRATGILLGDGDVLIAGGVRNSSFTGAPWAAAERFKVSSGVFVGDTSMNVTRYDAGAALLASGKVLFAGGIVNSGESRQAGQSVELYQSTANQPAVSNANVPDGSTSAPYSVTLVGVGGSGGGYSFSLVSGLLPPGLSLNGQVCGNAVICGQPTQTGTFYFGVRTTDGANQTGTQTLRIRINALEIANTPLPTGHVNIAYNAALALKPTDVGVAPVSWSLVSASGPAWNPPLAVSSTGTITGTPTSTCCFTITVRAQDAIGQIATASFPIQVNPAMFINGMGLPNGMAGQSYPAQTLTTNNAVAPVTWSLQSGSLPPSMTLSTGGVISGTPSSSGFYSFTVKAIDSIGQQATQNFSININQPLTITTTQFEDGVATWGYGGCIGWNGGIGTVTFSLTSGTASLPRGVTLASNGCFSGAPLQTGTFTISVQATDQSAQTASNTFTIRVGAPDQTGAVDSQPNPPLITFSGGTSLAQVFTPRLSGFLLDVHVPILCTAGVTVELRGVTSGQPNGTVLASTTLPQSFFWNTTPTFRLLRFASPVFVPKNVPVAFALTAPSGSCTVTPMPANPPGQSNGYTGGDAFTGSTGSWTAISASDPSRTDIPFNTIVDDGGRLSFMSSWRNQHTETRITSGPLNGLVLLTGGYGSFASTDLFNPTNTAIAGVPAGRFAAGPPMITGRVQHTATAMPDGSVIVIGGMDIHNTAVASAERLDPTTLTWQSMASLSAPRFGHTATLLGDGRVLVAGGHALDWSSQLSTTEILSLANTFSAGPSMTTSRADHRAVKLPGVNGRVLITGGWGTNTLNGAELFDPSSNGFSIAGPMNAARARHTATLLNDGRVLVAGGSDSANGGTVATAELFNPSDGSFTALSAGDTREDARAVVLNDGRVLIAGGYTHTFVPLDTTTLFNPSTNAFDAGSDLVLPRAYFTATHLADDRVLIAGGCCTSNAQGNSAEFFDPSVQSAAPGLVNSAYNSGGVSGSNSYAIVGGALPSGLALNASTGAITGTPTVSGTFHVVIEITDASGHKTLRELTIQINGPLAVSTTAVPDGILGMPYHAALEATGGSGARSWSVTAGSLPSGVTLSNDGLLSGTPTASGAFPFTAAVTDTQGGSASRAFVLVVDSPWTSSFPDGGIVLPGAFTVDPDNQSTIYAALNWRGLYKSTDSGDSWKNVTDAYVNPWPFDRTGLMFFKVMPSTHAFYAITNGTAFKSVTQGQSWINLGLPPYVNSLAIAPGEGVVYGATSGGVYKSVNGGSWTAINAGLPADTVLTLTVSSAGDGYLYAGTQNSGLYRTTDGGATWAAMNTYNTGLPLTQVTGIAVNPSVPSIVYAVGRDMTGMPSVARSSLSGASWDRLSGLTGLAWQTGQNLLAVDGATDTLYVGSFGSVVSWIAGGSPNASPIPESFQVNAVAIDGSGRVYAGTNGVGVFRSPTPSMTTWDAKSTNLRGINFPHSFSHSVDFDQSNPTTIYAGSINGGYQSANSGVTWQTMHLPYSSASTIATHVSLPGVVYAFQNDLFKTTDGGTTWTDVTGSLGSWGDGDFVIDPGQPTTLYLAAANHWNGTSFDTSADGIYKSKDGGTTWALFNTGLPSPAEFHTLAINPQNGNVLFAATQGGGRFTNVPTADQGIYRTLDGGQNWTQLHGGLPTPINVDQIVIHPAQPNLVYAAAETTNGGIWKSTDGGDTWTRVLIENANTVAVDSSAPNVVYAGTWNTNGFYVSRDGGATWRTFNAGLPIQAGIESIAVDPSNPRHLVLGTTAGEFHTTFSAPFADLSVSIADSPDPASLDAPLVYTVTVTNLGAAAATGVALSDPLPAYVQFAGVSTTQGTCSNTSGTVQCSLGALGASQAATVTITTTPHISGMFSNTATVTSATPDVSSLNNSATAVTTAQSATSNSSGLVGGPGGSEFTMSCPSGSAVTALKGQAGDDIDRTELWCAPFVPNGYGTASLTSSVGGFGGNPYDQSCPAGMALTGIHGRIGVVAFGETVVDTIGANCRNVTTGATYQFPEVGNPYQGTNGFSISCPAGQMVVGIYGRHGSVLDAVGVICR